MTKTEAARLRRTPAQRIRAARAWADMTQAEVAERLGLSLRLLKKVEAGQRDISDEQLEKIGRICDVPARFMLQGFYVEPSRRRSARRRADMVLLAELEVELERLRERVQSLEEERRDEAGEPVELATRGP